LKEPELSHSTEREDSEPPRKPQFQLHRHARIVQRVKCHAPWIIRSRYSYKHNIFSTS